MPTTRIKCVNAVAVMGVVQVTVQSVAGPTMLGAAAASVQFSRSVGAAFGTAIVMAVLFAALAVRDQETARLFANTIQRGGDVLAGLPAGRQATVKAEISEAFRAAFYTIAGFTTIGLALAWSSPARRLE